MLSATSTGAPYDTAAHRPGANGAVACPVATQVFIDTGTTGTGTDENFSSVDQLIMEVRRVLVAGGCFVSVSHSKRPTRTPRACTMTLWIRQDMLPA